MYKRLLAREARPLCTAADEQLAFGAGRSYAGLRSGRNGDRLYTSDDRPELRGRNGTVEDLARLDRLRSDLPRLHRFLCQLRWRDSTFLDVLGPDQAVRVSRAGRQYKEHRNGRHHVCVTELRTRA